MRVGQTPLARLGRIWGIVQVSSLGRRSDPLPCDIRPDRTLSFEFHAPATCANSLASTGRAMLAGALI